MSSPVTFSSPGTPAASTYGSTPPDKLMHASLIVMEPPASATTGEPGAQIDEIKFQFNPKELSLTKTAKWKRSDQRNAKKSAPPEFTGSDPAKLQLEMFLDGTEKMDDSVVKTVEKLFQCCVPTAKSNSNTKSSPPWVKFVWGGMHSFPGAITTVTAKYTLFSSSGTPIRALCTLTLEEISGTTPGQNPTSGSLAGRDVHTTTIGDTLASVAYSAYGNPELWRDLAEANNIDNPMALRPGTRLLIPALEDLNVGGRG
ncbi:LysM peptidoglycan-binding domain-containing protein [Fodinicola feengrottensis]|uniref:LysM peptidoglycan-binding domain-containing protein n=1 Tax=Fodinicola feengrottensis TaxID=435914 RepID=A0ABP4RX70_9ACTN